ncbi:hypothetical protein [Synechococcus sp. PROS-7-1]|uniref:DUF7734 family protein n=1 Tax=Synechococcus sp. PROS-7-1 TaxID=1442556 RepID=UPI0016457A40|nr:hypothetical protein [Synechococcus sp. PROS-7-1]
MNSDSLLPALEAISRDRPDRVLRLRGTVQSSEGAEDVLEVLIFRGFSSCTTHPTDFDPDQSVLPDGAALETAELLRGPLNPQQEERLLGPLPVAALMDREVWA